MANPSVLEAIDQVRRKCGKLTAKQLNLPNAQFGDPAPNQPRPDNTEIKQAIRSAQTELNRKVGFHGTTSDAVSIPLTAQTANGPQYVDLALGYNIGTGNAINYIHHAKWTPTGGSTVSLIGRSIDEMNTAGYDFANMPPGTPQYYWVEHYTLFIFPATDTAGKLGLQAGLSIIFPVVDTDSFPQMPYDYIDVMLNLAVTYLAAMNPDDAGMQLRAKQYGPMAQDGILEMQQWYNTTVKDAQHIQMFKSHRNFRGGRRR